MMDNDAFVVTLRQQFPALNRQLEGEPAVYFDGPAGTQVPERVARAVSDYLLHHNANLHGKFATSQESDELLERAGTVFADFLGTPHSDCLFFGPNMTSLTFAMSRALSRNWNADDEIVVTDLDHDANVTPWVLAARDVGARVRRVPIVAADCTLDTSRLKDALGPRTRLVAVGCASNSSGSINPVRDICHWTHEVGALAFIDAVHWAPHTRTNITELGCDFLVCSAYKFFGPHLGIMWGRKELLRKLNPYKVRPAPNTLPDRWMTGTQNHEGIAGAVEAVEYLADVGRQWVQNQGLDRRQALDIAFDWLRSYEQELIWQLLDSLAQIDSIRVAGITDAKKKAHRLPTVSLIHAEKSPEELARELGQRGVFVWHGNYYGLGITESLQLEPDGMVRIGLTHYNTKSEVDRVLDILRQ